MPAGILSDMIQQYKAIFEGEPIELGPEDSTPPLNQSTSEPSRTERGVPADATQASETTKRGNRNSMIYATNSDVLLNSVGRELTGESWLNILMTTGFLSPGDSRSITESGDAEESDGGEIVAFDDDDEYPLSSSGGSPTLEGPTHRDLYRISEAASVISPRLQTPQQSPGLPKSPRLADVTSGFSTDGMR